MKGTFYGTELIHAIEMFIPGFKALSKIVALSMEIQQREFRQSGLH